MPDETNNATPPSGSKRNEDQSNESRVSESASSQPGEALAVRLRAAVDGRVAPVTLGDVRRRVDAGHDLDRDGDPGVRTGRSRWSVMAAAAAVVLVLGVSVAIAARSTDPYTSTVPPSGPDGPSVPGSVPAAPGGIYDPTSPALLNRALGSIETAGSLVYLVFKDAADPQGLASVLVADVDTGEILATHPLLSRAGPGPNSYPPSHQLVSVGGRIWLLELDGRTDDDGVGSLLVSLRGTDPPERVAELDQVFTLGADGDDLILQSNDRIQRRRGTDGTLIDEAPWTGAGSPADGWSTIQREPALVRRDGMEAVDIYELEDGEVDDTPWLVRATENRVFVARGSRLIEVDAGTGAVVRSRDMGGTISGMDRAGELVWITTVAGRGAEDRSSSDGTLAPSSKRLWVVIDARTGEEATFDMGPPSRADLGKGEFPVVAALDDGTGVACFSVFEVPGDTASSVAIVCRRDEPLFSPSGGTSPDETSPTPPSSVAVVAESVVVGSEDLGNGWRRTEAPAGFGPSGLNANGREGFSVVTATVGGERRVLVWGGGADGEDDHADGYSFDPAANTWEALPAAPLSARSGHQAVWTGSSMIVWGGGTMSEDGSQRVPLSDGAAYDPARRQWRTIAPSPLTGGTLHASAWTGTEMIVLGGMVGPDLRMGPRGALSRQVAAYNPATDSWRGLPDIPIDLSFAEAHWTGGQVVIAGGVVVNNDQFTNLRGATLVAALDPSSGGWLIGPEGGPSSQAIDSAWVDGRLLVATYYPPLEPGRWWSPAENAWSDLDGYPLTDGCEDYPVVVAIPSGAIVEVCGAVARYDSAADGWSLLTPPAAASDGSGFQALASFSTVSTGTEVISVFGDGSTVIFTP